MYKQFLRPGLKDITPPDEEWLEDWRPPYDPEPHESMQKDLDRYQLPPQQTIVREFSLYALLVCRDDTRVVYVLYNGLINEPCRINYPTDLKSIIPVLRYYDTDVNVRNQFMVLEALPRRGKGAPAQIPTSMMDQLLSQPSRRPDQR